MDVKVFLTFIEVSQERHFGKAAENLFITQAAVSARIKQLEAFYNAELFTRNRNAIQLTLAGQRLLPYAHRFVETMTQSKADLLLTNQQMGYMTLAGTPNSWDSYLKSNLSRITKSCSGFRFNAETLSREQMNRSLLDKSLDMGFSLDALKSEELISKKMAELELILVSSIAQSAEQAVQNGYIYVDWGLQFERDHQERHPHIRSPILRASNSNIALEFILENGGSAYLSKADVNSQLMEQRLYVVEDLVYWLRPVYIHYRKNASSLAQIQQIIRTLTLPTP